MPHSIVITPDIGRRISHPAMKWPPRHADYISKNYLHNISAKNLMNFLYRNSEDLYKL